MKLYCTKNAVILCGFAWVESAANEQLQQYDGCHRRSQYFCCVSSEMDQRGGTKLRLYTVSTQLRENLKRGPHTIYEFIPGGPQCVADIIRM